MDRFLIGSSACSCCSISFTGWGQTTPQNINPIQSLCAEDTEKTQRKQFKAECYAHQMLQQIIGMDEWRIYRETYIVAVKAKSVWLIGNVFKNYNKFHPFARKPDVLRLDKRNIWHKITTSKDKIPATSFCVDPATREEMPYTDKVVSYIVQCAHEENEFYKMANRLNEVILKKIGKTAMYDITSG